ncbi:hypothetical protein ACFV4T_06090 [Streptomyces sp. NPDC059755]
MDLESLDDVAGHEARLRRDAGDAGDDVWCVPGSPMCPGGPDPVGT